MTTRRRTATSTSNFGVGRREAHDARAFYERFSAPEISTDETVLPPSPVDEPFICGDSRSMEAVADGSVALVVTSPPYFAGKQYEEDLTAEGVPGSYLEYLELLHDVFAECVRALEPGGRIAVNVANLGRKPYRSLSADVTTILQDSLHLLLRGEIIWRKAEGATGSCAWGSFRGASNPVLRDTTERVIVASKGRFDRALSAAKREKVGLPHRSPMLTEDFMANTLDVWDLPPERAKRVGHPAPFPIELPERLIELHTFEDDLVLDPFMGSGSTMVAAALMRRRFIGYDTDPHFVAIARSRVAEEIRELTLFPSEPISDAARNGKGAVAIAKELLEQVGFIITHEDAKVRGTGTSVSFIANDADGAAWHFDVAGPYSSHRGGLLRTDTVWRTLGRASALVNQGVERLVILTTNLPAPSSPGDVALRAAGPSIVFDLVSLLTEDGMDRLRNYARGGHSAAPLSGFWAPGDLRLT